MLEKFSAMIGVKGAAQDKRRRGDQLRDAGKFADAAEAYGAYLAECADDFAIWVQRGNCLKDSASYQAAAMAYERAIQIKPDDADVHLQMGHLMKLRGMHDAAVDAYARALELNPRMAAARRELGLLGYHKELVVGSMARPPSYVFDLSDVFFYLRHHTAVSGIQRVQLGIVESLIASEQKSASCCFIASPHDGGEYIEISSSTIRALIRMLKQQAVSLAGLKTIIDQAFADGQPMEFLNGDTLVVLGAFWVMPTQMSTWIELKEEGVHLVILVHDIIPITNPEYCVSDLVDTFTQCFQHVLRMADLILSISAYSQGRITELLDRWKIPRPPMAVVPNAHQTWATSRMRQTKFTREIQDILADNDFVLYVSTIEIRKNHTLLFRVWKRLIEARGPENVPRLVLVGRQGWRVQDLMDQLAGTGYLDGKIVILNDISDSELEALYQACLFTTFTSYEEGWGLPVGESLVYGRPCIASNASSIPEVAGDLVDYIDPNNLESAYAVIGKMIEDTAYRERRARQIKEEFRPRSWAEVANDLYLTLGDKLPAQPSSETLPARSIGKSAVYRHLLEPGRIYKIGHEDKKTRYIHNGLGGVVSYLFDRNWYPVENFGRWMKNQQGQITFRVAGPPDGEFIVYLQLCAVSWYGGNPVILTANGAKQTVTGLRPNRPQLTRVRMTAKNEIVSMELRVSGDPALGSDPRRDLCVGLMSVAYARADDVIARQEIIESILLA